jgi:hypothetical protein
MATSKQDLDRIKSALDTIKGYQRRAASGARVRWRLEIPAWRLGLEGLAAFLVAFVSGKGLGILYQILFDS